MALNARGIPACFLGSAQLSAQVKEDAWRGGPQGGAETLDGCTCAAGRTPASCLLHACLVPSQTVWVTAWSPMSQP